MQAAALVVTIDVSTVYDADMVCFDAVIMAGGDAARSDSPG